MLYGVHLVNVRDSNYQILYSETKMVVRFFPIYYVTFKIIFILRIVAATKGWNIRVMVFNATFNDISVTSGRSVLLMEETGVNHRPVASQ